MNIIQERIEKVAAMIQKVKAHHMCLSFEESSEHYLIAYPHGFTYPAAIRVAKDNNKAIALARLLPMMDKHWDESCFWK